MLTEQYLVQQRQVKPMDFVKTNPLRIFVQYKNIKCELFLPQKSKGQSVLNSSGKRQRKFLHRASLILAEQIN